MVKFKAGKSYKITFLDHASFESMDDAQPYKCVVRGMVSKIDKSYLIVQCWITYELDGSVCGECTGGYIIMIKDILDAVELHESPSV